MSGHIPDFEEISESNRPQSDPEFDREDTLTGMGRRGNGEHRDTNPERIPPPMSSESDAPPMGPTIEQQLSAAIVMLSERVKLTERQQLEDRLSAIKNDIRGVHEIIVRVDADKEAKHKRELGEVLGRVDAWGAEMRARTPGPAWKALVLAMIAVGLICLGGLGMVVLRGSRALEQIQQHQLDRVQRQQEQSR